MNTEVLRAAKGSVGYKPQTRVVGDRQQLPGHRTVAERWSVLAGEAAGGQAASDVTVFDSVGFALEDYAA